MNLRLLIVCLTTSMASGCSANPVPEFGSVELLINSATATSCQSSSCNSIVLDVTIKNMTDIPVCFSARYLTRVSSVIAVYQEGETDTDNFMVNPPPLEEFPDTPDQSAKHVAVLKREPNIHVAPGQELRFTTATADQYAIPKTVGILVALPVYVYPCDGEGFERLQQSAVLSFG